MWRYSLVAAAGLGLSAAAAAVAGDGAYLFHAAGCHACHTAEDGAPLAGGRAFATAYGTFYSPNITPHPEQGIGRWTRRQFVDAVKRGTAPDGSPYFPAFPYPSYQRMTDADAGAIFDYLLTREPHPQANRPHELPWWVQRWMMRPWQWWLLEEPAPPPTGPELARGHYLVEALGHCGECHTPRKLTGVLDRARHLAGSKQGPDGAGVPNVTPDRATGIGKWSGDDLAWFLETGELPDGDYTGGAMAEVVDHGTSRLTSTDREAIAAYLKSLPPLPSR